MFIIIIIMLFLLSQFLLPRASRSYQFPQEPHGSWFPWECQRKSLSSWWRALFVKYGFSTQWADLLEVFNIDVSRDLLLLLSLLLLLLFNYYYH